jgi:hypothetical protein
VPGFIGLGKIGCGLGAGVGEEGFGTAISVAILSRGREIDQPDRDLGDQRNHGHSEGASEWTQVAPLVGDDAEGCDADYGEGADGQPRERGETACPDRLAA